MRLQSSELALPLLTDVADATQSVRSSTEAILAAATALANLAEKLYAYTRHYTAANDEPGSGKIWLAAGLHRSFMGRTRRPHPGTADSGGR